MLVFKISPSHPEKLISALTLNTFEGYDRVFPPLSLVAECRGGLFRVTTMLVRHVVEGLVDEASLFFLPHHTPRRTLPHASQCIAPSGLFPFPYKKHVLNYYIPSLNPSSRKTQLGCILHGNCRRFIQPVPICRGGSGCLI